MVVIISYSLIFLLLDDFILLDYFQFNFCLLILNSIYSVKDPIFYKIFLLFSIAATKQINYFIFDRFAWVYSKNMKSTHFCKCTIISFVSYVKNFKVCFNHLMKFIILLFVQDSYNTWDFRVQNPLLLKFLLDFIQAID